MATFETLDIWPPSDLNEYYNSTHFYSKLTLLEKRLERHYQNTDVHSIIFDAAADLLLKEVERYAIYNIYMIKYQSEADFLRYLYETCCRKIIDNARSFQRKFRQLHDEENIQDDGLTAEQAAIEREEAEQRSQLVKDLEEKVIKKLPKLDRQILKHRLSGQTLQEIASKLDIGVTTVHRRFKAITRKLADELEGRESGQKIKPTP